MFFILSKLLGLLLNPLLWILTPIVLSVFIRKYRVRLIYLSIGLFLFLSNSLPANLVMRWLETPRQELPPGKNIGIMLTGVVEHLIQIEDQVSFSEGADRYVETISLLQQGKIDRIIIVGGSGSILDQEFSESEKLLELAMKMGIPDSLISIEPDSRNTHENAELGVRILKNSFPDYNPVLITSSFHMKRSILCFKKEGMEVDPYPVDFRSTLNIFDYNLLFPDIGAIEKWQIVTKELVGLIFYRLAGYI